jgi:uncharacterized membrane protein
MDQRRKLQVLAWLILAILMLMFLSTGLPQIEMHGGRPFSLGGTAPPLIGGGAAASSGEIFLMVFSGGLAVAMMLLPLYIIFNLITRRGRARLLTDLIALALMLLALILLPRNAAQPASQESEQAPALAPPTSSVPPVQFVPHVPTWLELLLIVALALLVAAIVAGVVWWVRKQRQPAPTGPLEQLAQKAQETIDALHAGEDIQDAVIRSYVQMSHVLQEERGIHRERAMTPYEFEQVLAEKGFPGEPVQELTRLFEAARYGHRLSGEKEEQRAILSLQAIVAYARMANGEWRMMQEAESRMQGA